MTAGGDDTNNAKMIMMKMLIFVIIITLLMIMVMFNTCSVFHCLQKQYMFQAPVLYFEGHQITIKPRAR